MVLELLVACTRISHPCRKHTTKPSLARLTREVSCRNPGPLCDLLAQPTAPMHAFAPIINQGSFPKHLRRKLAQSNRRGIFPNTSFMAFGIVATFCSSSTSSSTDRPGPNRSSPADLENSSSALPCSANLSLWRCVPCGIHPICYINCDHCGGPQEIHGELFRLLWVQLLHRLLGAVNCSPA
jgi:hypothetical protein